VPSVPCSWVVCQTPGAYAFLPPMSATRSLRFWKPPKAAKNGTVEVTVDTASVDYGLDRMNEKAKGEELFDVGKYPTATYKGKLDGFRNGAPTEVVGEFTLHGVTKPLTLKIASFKCMPHPIKKDKEVCGADALATFNRADYGMDAGKKYGFKMEVNLRIQVEAVQEE